VIKKKLLTKKRKEEMEGDNIYTVCIFAFLPLLKRNGKWKNRKKLKL
jgi:hypothetical protein